MRFTHRLGVLRGDLFQRRESLLRALRLEDTFKMPLIARHLRIKSQRMTNIRRGKLFRLDSTDAKDAKP